MRTCECGKEFKSLTGKRKWCWECKDGGSYLRKQKREWEKRMMNVLMEELEWDIRAISGRAWYLRSEWGCLWIGPEPAPRHCDVEVRREEYNNSYVTGARARCSVEEMWCGWLEGVVEGCECKACRAARLINVFREVDREVLHGARGMPDKVDN